MIHIRTIMNDFLHSMIARKLVLKMTPILYFYESNVNEKYFVWDGNGICMKIKKLSEYLERNPYNCFHKWRNIQKSLMLIKLNYDN